MALNITVGGYWMFLTSLGIAFMVARVLFRFDMKLSSIYTFCDISGSHCGEYEDDRLLGYSAVSSRWSYRTFQRCVLPVIIGRSSHLWNVSLFQWDYTAVYPTRLSSSYCRDYRVFSCVVITLSVNFIICTHPQISLGKSSQSDEVGGACGTHGRGEKSEQSFGGKDRGKECTWKTKA
jgi:hypothetical protein